MTENSFKWGFVFWLLYVAVGLVQLSATYDGLRYWLGWHWLVLAPLAFIVGYIPLLGSIAGMVGAHMIWRWEVLPSLLLFFWYVPLYAGFLVTSYFFNSPRKASSTTVASSGEIEMAVGQDSSTAIVVPAKRNIFIRAFNGDLKLWVTYWIFGVIVLKIVEVMIVFGFGERTANFWAYLVHNYGMIAFQTIAIALALLVIAYKVAIIRGIWTSASRYAGPKAWAVLAKVLMVLWAIGIVPEFLEMSAILKLEDPSGMAAPKGSLDMYGDMVRNLLN